LEPAYLRALAERFGAGLRLVDYIGATEAARAEINGWVAEQTEERIEELLAQDTLDARTRLVLVNAIYLKAAWLVPFEEEATRQEPFERLDRSTLDVPMMHAIQSLPYATGQGWRAVEIPYVGEQLGMVVIVPDDLAGFEAGFDAASFESIVGALAPQQVALGLPRFGLETQVELGVVLADLGMPTAFTDLADFTGITTQEPLQISAVIHQANIDVDEEGTEAAAATAVVMRATGMPAEPVAFTVDRPFVYALRDRVTGAILFLGRVTEPTERGA
jgi:serpin B